MTFSRIHPPYAATLLAVMLNGCSAVGPESDPSEPVAATESPIAAYKFDTWTAWSMPINVCFTKSTVTGQIPTDTQYSALKALAMSAAQGSWGTVPGVSIVNKGDCSGTTSTYLHIDISWGPWWGGVCGVGVGTTCSVGGGTDDQPMQEFFKSVVVHEVGHALGFPHEHQRVDAVNCNQALVDACNRCKHAVDAGQACAAADWNTCVVPDTLVTTPQVFGTNSAQYGKLQEMLGNNGPDASFVLLTAFDPLSIMSYCAEQNGRAQGDSRPTPLDLLGLEMLYPVNSNYPIGCQNGCFATGTGAITRTDGFVTTNWMARGARSITLINPNNGLEATSLATSSLPAGSSQLTFKFRAPRTGALLTTAGTLVNANDAHAALVAVLSATTR
jgi:hypothetical protein